MKREIKKLVYYIWNKFHSSMRSSSCRCYGLSLIQRCDSHLHCRGHLEGGLLETQIYEENAKIYLKKLLIWFIRDSDI